MAWFADSIINRMSEFVRIQIDFFMRKTSALVELARVFAGACVKLRLGEICMQSGGGCVYSGESKVVFSIVHFVAFV